MTESEAREVECCDCGHVHKVGDRNERPHPKFPDIARTTHCPECGSKKFYTEDDE